MFARPSSHDDPTLDPVPLTDLGGPGSTSTTETRPPTRSSDVPAPAQEAIRHLLNRYEMSTGKQLPAVIAVTSAVRGEGVTTLSRALASVLSQDLVADVTWIDLSWRTVNGKKTAVVPSPPGISEVLRGLKDVESVAFSDPAQPGLRLVPIGDQSPGDQSRLARSNALSEAINELLRTSDHVILDAGAMLDGTQTPISIRHADAYLFVVQHGAATEHQVRAATEDLSTIPSLGAVLNRYRSRTPAFIRRRFTD